MAQNDSNSTRHDRLLEQSVQDALDSYTPLRINKYSITMSASDGAVRLSGSVRSQAVKETAESLARGVKGVTSVSNQIVNDGDLELAIAQALAVDPRTRAGFPGILVGVVFGTAFLKGSVGSEEIKQAAGEIASQVVGVHRVSNELVAPKPAAPARVAAKPAAASVEAS